MIDECDSWARNIGHRIEMIAYSIHDIDVSRCLDIAKIWLNLQDRRGGEGVSQMPMLLHKLM